ncbi:MAG TPA: monovalent cation/H(+) antiporter subunit G [Acidobacteriaceae bacterium]
MSAHPHLVHALVAGLLGLTVACCALGVLGMWRMPNPTQALHYLSLPSAMGSITLTLAVLVQSGFHPVFFKTAAIAAVLLSFNAVVTHATARAFRVRDLGHWEPRDGDPFTWVEPEDVA